MELMKLTITEIVDGDKIVELESINEKGETQKRQINFFVQCAHIEAKNSKGEKYEICFSPEGYRYYGSRDKGVVPIELLESVNFYDTHGSHKKISISVRENSQWNKNTKKVFPILGRLGLVVKYYSYEKTLGVFEKLEDQLKFKDFLEKLNFKVRTPPYEITDHEFKIKPSKLDGDALHLESSNNTRHIYQITISPTGLRIKSNRREKLFIQTARLEAVNFYQISGRQLKMSLSILADEERNKKLKKNRFLRWKLFLYGLSRDYENHLGTVCSIEDFENIKSALEKMNIKVNFYPMI